MSPSVLMQSRATHFMRITDTQSDSQKRGVIHSFIHQIFTEHLLSAGTFLDTGDLATNRRDEVSAPSNVGIFCSSGER